MTPAGDSGRGSVVRHQDWPSALEVDQHGRGWVRWGAATVPRCDAAHGARL